MLDNLPDELRYSASVEDVAKRLEFALKASQQAVSYPGYSKLLLMIRTICRNVMILP